MQDDSHDHDNAPRLLSDGESTPNSIGVWLVIAVIVSVVMVLSDHGGAISSLLFLFGPVILIIIAAGKAAEWASSRHAFDKPGGETQPPSDESQTEEPSPSTTQGPGQQVHPDQ